MARDLAFSEHSNAKRKHEREESPLRRMIIHNKPVGDKEADLKRREGMTNDCKGDIWWADPS